MPHNRIQKLCSDVLTAITELEQLTAGRTEAHVATDRTLQLVLEREFEIIGEALYRLRQEREDLLDRITDSRRIIGLRNILAHGYDIIEHKILWAALVHHLPMLKVDIQTLQKEFE